jgi:hypothetical protein
MQTAGYFQRSTTYEEDMDIQLDPDVGCCLQMQPPRLQDLVELKM